MNKKFWKIFIRNKLIELGAAGLITFLMVRFWGEAIFAWAISVLKNHLTIAKILILGWPVVACISVVIIIVLNVRDAKEEAKI